MIPTKINGKHTHLYMKWDAMRRRCQNPKHKSYHCYGGKGVKVCAQWQNFQSFARWCIDNGYVDDDRRLSIDRIDVDGCYTPENCRIIPMNENSSIAAKNRIGTRNPNYGNQWSIEQRLRRSKPFTCVETGIQYISLGECNRDTGISIGMLSLVLNKKQPSAFGLHFEYIDTYYRGKEAAVV